MKKKSLENPKQLKLLPGEKRKIAGVWVEDVKEIKVNEKALEKMTDYYKKKLDELNWTYFSRKKGINVTEKEKEAIALAIANFKLRNDLELKVTKRALVTLTDKLLNNPYFREAVERGRAKEGLELEIFMREAMKETMAERAGYNYQKDIAPITTELIKREFIRNPQTALEDREEIRKRIEERIPREVRETEEAISLLEKLKRIKKEAGKKKKMEWGPIRAIKGKRRR